MRFQFKTGSVIKMASQIQDQCVVTKLQLQDQCVVSKLQLQDKLAVTQLQLQDKREVSNLQLQCQCVDSNVQHQDDPSEISKLQNQVQSCVISKLQLKDQCLLPKLEMQNEPCGISKLQLQDPSSGISKLQLHSQSVISNLQIKDRSVNSKLQLQEGRPSISTLQNQEQSSMISKLQIQDRSVISKLQNREQSSMNSQLQMQNPLSVISKIQMQYPSSVISMLDHFIRYAFTRRQRTIGTRWLLYQVLTISLVIVLLLGHSHAQTEVKDTCMGCLLFYQHTTHQPDKEKKENELCHYPCHCPEYLACQDGVSVVKDGCSCCYMCARQIGDMCSARDVCDGAKGLFCDSTDTSSTGTCKGRDKNPCMVDGVMYKDGEKFQPECSQLCTCQNGFYGCVNTCPQEIHKPSELTCHEPKLIEAKNKCCKEWTCQKLEASGSSVLNGLESDNLILHNPVWHHSSTLVPQEDTTSLTTIPFQQCYKKTTDWTPCSLTCDVGVSIRIVVDPITCNNYQELQLCYLRPCDLTLKTKEQKKCTPTSRRYPRHHIKYQDCLSVKDYSLKFCTNCRENQCCFPRRTITRPIEFQCSDGKREVYNYMWIKKCRCGKTCLRSSSTRRHGNGKRREWKKRRQQGGKKRRRFKI
uniref:CTCK domain-containing protein n=1 Tax=Arion vulgaris TaxID=1028688 RepID=A0A0B6ZWE6_9EUPU